MTLRLAFIGAVGVPNNYGGFELFLDSCTPALARRFDEVWVTCDSGKYDQKNPDWHGVRRIFIPVRANGALSVLHDLLAFFAVFWRSDVVIVLGLSGGIFFPLFRLLCSLFSKKLVVNVDGVEWRRGKFSRLRRAFLFVSDRMAQFFSHQVVIDNEGLREYLTAPARRKAWLIAYPGDHVLRTNRETDRAGPEPHCLTICRIEPENNCRLLLEAFAGAGRGRYVFVGNWNASRYGRKLRQSYRDCPGLDMRDPTYDKSELASLRDRCNIYLHGHSVGGTNPSLVEMLFYDCMILAFDCSFNRCTGGEALQYFSDHADLAERLRTISEYPCIDRAGIRSLYTVEGIASAYARLAEDVFRPGKAGRAAADAAVKERA